MSYRFIAIIVCLASLFFTFSLDAIDGDTPYFTDIFSASSMKENLIIAGIFSAIGCIVAFAVYQKTRAGSETSK